MTVNSFCRLTLLGLGLILFSRSAFAQKKEYQGLLWEITGNGLKKPCYLYGTMHVSNKVAFHLTDSFFTGLRGADVIALESDPGTWMDEMMDPEYPRNRMYRYGNYNMGNGFYEKAFFIDYPKKSELTRLFNDQNEMLNGMLYRMSPMAENYQENTYLDLFIYQTGKKDKKIVTNLENFDETMRLYKKALKPAKGEKRNYGYSKLAKKGVDSYEVLEDAYRKGDLDMIDSLNTITAPTKHYRKYFLDQRNEIMAGHMDSIMKSGKSLFTAVGAAHLPGDMGMINLLRKMGYNVRAVNGSVTKASMGVKDKIEKNYLSLSYGTRYPSDSSFQVDMPGKLYEMPGGGDRRLYMYPEMINGGYFTVVRIKTYGALNGKSPEYITSSIDSMLYENVPGKIVRRSTIKSNTGYPGFDILTRTRSGDNLRYKIFVSPQEIFVFMVGGRGDYARKKEVEKFFSSIRFSGKNSGEWKKINYPSASYEIEMPGTVLRDKPKFGLQNEKVTAYEAGDSAYYMLIKASLHDLQYIEEDTFELGRLAESFAEQLNYTLEKKTLTSFSGYPAMDIALKGNTVDKEMVGKIVIQGSHYYMVATTASSDISRKRFLNSFRLQDVKYIDTFVDKVDSNVYARVTYPQKPKEESASELDDYREYALYRDEDEEDKSYEGENTNETYHSDASDENITVTYTRFHKYYSIQKDSFWKEQVNRLVETNNLIIKSKTLTEKDGVSEMNLLLTDTGSIRAVRVRLIQKDGVFYRIGTLTDTLTEPSLWVKTFFTNFTPIDSVMGQSPFADKTALFLKDLQSGDTTLRKQALNSINVFSSGFDKKHAPELMKYMKTDAFKKLSLDKKLQFIPVLSNVKDQSSITLLRQLYAGASDSVAQQIAILRTLGWQQTEKSAAAFIDLLNMETPLTSEEDEISSLFYPFSDSLPLAKKLYPGLLEYTTYPEYKSEVYTLLASLVDSGYVKKEVYAASKRRILKEANEELRRQFASEEKENMEDYEDYGMYTDDYSEDDEYANQYNYGNLAIYNYTVLLVPYYNEPAVKAYFDKLKRSQDKALRLSTSILLLRHNLPVHDSVWASYAKDESWRLRLYGDLKDVKRLDKFPDSSKTQLSFARAALNGSADKKDTLEYIGKRYVQNKYDKGYVYFFKRKMKDTENDWKLEYVGLQPEDTTQVSTSLEYTARYGHQVSGDEKEINEEINKIVKDLTMAGRKRVSLSSSGNRYDYYYDY